MVRHREGLFLDTPFNKVSRFRFVRRPETSDEDRHGAFVVAQIVCLLLKDFVIETHRFQANPQGVLVEVTYMDATTSPEEQTLIPITRHVIATHL